MLMLPRENGPAHSDPDCLMGKSAAPTLQWHARLIFALWRQIYIVALTIGAMMNEVTEDDFRRSQTVAFVRMIAGLVVMAAGAMALMFFVARF